MCSTAMSIPRYVDPQKKYTGAKASDDCEAMLALGFGAWAILLVNLEHIRRAWSGDWILSLRSLSINQELAFDSNHGLSRPQRAKWRDLVLQFHPAQPWRGSIDFGEFRCSGARQTQDPPSSLADMD